MSHVTSDTRCRVQLTLNGRVVQGYVEPRTLLCDFLRHGLGATGTHVGCEHGVCGACTVCLNGSPVRSCLMFAVQAEGQNVDTVEGLAAEDGQLCTLQQAFRHHHALQCGFCTPGILMSLNAYLKAHRTPTEREVRAVLSGHLCRCTGYTGIVRAVMEVVSGGSRETGDGHV